MKYLGVIAFVLIIIYSSYPARVKKLESKIAKLQRILKGGKSMSKILSDLIDKKCILISEEGISLVSKMGIECTVLDVDDEWIKFTFVDKKGDNKTQILRIDSIERVDFVEN